jgi:hypothetical protein
MHTPYIQRMVNLEPLDYRIVRRLAERKGPGRRGFSAILWFGVRSANLPQVWNLREVGFGRACGRALDWQMSPSTWGA